MRGGVPGPAEVPAKRTSRAAVATLVLGVLSLLFYFLFPPNFILANPVADNAFFTIPSVVTGVCGIISLRRISRSAVLKGKKYAIAGLMLASPPLFFSIGNIIIAVLYSYA
jgi:hypothetical protein